MPAASSYRAWASSSAPPPPGAAAAEASKATIPTSAQLLSLSNEDSPAALRAAWPKPTFDVAQVKHLLDHDNHEMRDKFRELMKQPLFQPRYNISLEDERELALKRLTVSTNGELQ